MRITPLISCSPLSSRNISLGAAPFKLDNALHYWDLENAATVGTTMTCLDTGSIGGINLINPTAAQLPSFSTIDGKQSVLSDGIDDILQNSSVTDFRAGDTSGVMHFVFRTPSSFAANNNILFSVSASGVLTDRFLVFIDATGKVRVVVSAAGTNTTLIGATTLSTSTNYVFSVYCDGALITGYLGTTLQFSSSGGAGNIRWFDDIKLTTNGVELLSREIGGASYVVTNQIVACYTPYVSSAAVLADQLILANRYSITV